MTFKIKSLSKSNYFKSRKKKLFRSLTHFKSNTFLLLSTLFILGIFSFQNLILSILLIVLLRSKLILCFIVVALSQLLCIYWVNLIEDDAKSFGETKTYIAQVVEPVERMDFNYQTVVKIHSLNSKTILKTTKDNLQTGQQIELKGTLKDLNKLDYPEWYVNYNNSKAIFSEITSSDIQIEEKSNSIIFITSKLKQKIMDNLSQYLSGDSFSLVTGIVFGNKANFDEDLESNLKNAGLTHIISASGFNVIFIYLIIFSFVGLINRKALNIIAIPLILLYVVFIGIEVLPAIRAGIMLIIIILAKILGRIPNILTALNISIIAILLTYPFYFKNISFQLSVLATIALFTLAPKIYNSIKNTIPIKGMVETASATIAIIIYTTPILFINFGEFSLLAVISNILVLPVVPIIMVLGFILIVTSFLQIQFISLLIAYICEYLVKYVAKVSGIIGGLSFSRVENLSIVLFIYILFFFSLIYLDYKKYKSKDEKIH